MMEPIDKDEANTIVFDVTSSMSREDVVEHVRKCIQWIFIKICLNSKTCHSITPTTLKILNLFYNFLQIQRYIKKVLHLI